MKKKVSKEVSEYFSALAKKRTDGNYGFVNKEVASAAGKKGNAAQQRAKKQAQAGQTQKES